MPPKSRLMDAQLALEDICQSLQMGEAAARGSDEGGLESDHTVDQ